jgi:hypothetical protein
MKITPYNLHRRLLLDPKSSGPRQTKSLKDHRRSLRPYSIKVSLLRPGFMLVTQVCIYDARPHMFDQRGVPPQPLYRQRTGLRIRE